MNVEEFLQGNKSDTAEEKEITEILKEEHTPARTVHELVCAANSHGGEDNITVMLLENTKESYPDA